MYSTRPQRKTLTKLCPYCGKTRTYMGDYTAVEAAPLLGIACATVSAYANSGARLRGRYRIEAVGNTEIDTERWAKEWDRVRQEILTAGR